MRNIESCLDWFTFPVEECYPSRHFYLENWTGNNAPLQNTHRVVQSETVASGETGKTWVGKRDTCRVDHDGFLFTRTLTSKQQNKELCPGNLDFFFFSLKWLKKSHFREKKKKKHFLKWSAFLTCSSRLFGQIPVKRSHSQKQGVLQQWLLDTHVLQQQCANSTGDNFLPFLE